jgi:hypothetical protein
MVLLEGIRGFFSAKKEVMDQIDYKMYYFPVSQKLAQQTPQVRKRMDELDQIIEETLKLSWIDWGIPIVGAFTAMVKIKKASPYVTEFSETLKQYRPLPRAYYTQQLVQATGTTLVVIGLVNGLVRLL